MYKTIPLLQHSIILDTCILCNKNKANVLITKCFHMVICDNCKNINHCPHCKRPINDIHKVTFQQKIF